MSVKELKSNHRTDKARHFLAELLDETLEWSNCDTQHDLADEFKYLLGDYCPDWIDPDLKTED